MKGKTSKRMLSIAFAFILVFSIGISSAPPQNTYAASSSSGTWIKESNGRWWYKHSDGSYTKYDWEYIDGSWYFFDKNGWMWTEWLEWEGDWYYLNPSGVMHTGWLKDDGKWYYFTSRGVMVKRWVLIGSSWYYFEPIGGHMRTSPFTYDFRKYTFYSTGELMQTEIKINRQEQERNLWCWAACDSMVGTYYTNSSVTQTDVVRHVKGRIINEGGNAAEEIQGLNFASNNTKSGRAVARKNVHFDDLVDYIDDNHPFIINMRWSNANGGHAITGAGYDLKSERIWIVDPAPNVDSDFYSFRGIMEGISLRSGTGSCNGIIVY